MIRALLVLAVAVLPVAPGWAQDKSAPTGGADAAATKSPKAVITMEKAGEITLEFFPKDAPKHVENFLSLAKKGFYDGQRVHRVEPNFVVQFGDPQSKTLRLSPEVYFTPSLAAAGIAPLAPLAFP